MIFSEQIAAFAKKVEARQRQLHTRLTQLVYESIVDGSAVTGAPGQPVDTSNLKTSWQIIIEGPLTSRVVTNVVYAQDIEDGMRHFREDWNGGEISSGLALSGAAGAELTLRSEVGGFHSVALTRAGLPDLVAQSLKELGDG